MKTPPGLAPLIIDANTQINDAALIIEGLHKKIAALTNEIARCEEELMSRGRSMELLQAVREAYLRVAKALSEEPKSSERCRRRNCPGRDKCIACPARQRARQETMRLKREHLARKAAAAA